MQLVDINGETYRVIGRGVTNDDGKVYMHLARESRFIEQKNGRRAIQIADWIDPECVYELASRTLPQFQR